MRATCEVLLLIVNCLPGRHARGKLAETRDDLGSYDHAPDTQFIWHDELTQILVNNETLRTQYVYDNSEEMVYGRPILWHKEMVDDKTEIYKTPRKSNAIENCNGCPEPSQYRTYDGFCNNCHEPRFGKAYTPFVRLLKPVFSNGIDSIPKSGHGGVLPQVRNLSTNLLGRNRRRDQHYTLILVFWGQFVAHDFARHAIRFKDEFKHIECCTEDGSYPLLLDEADGACHFILLSLHDFFYSKYKKRCMNFVRSLAMVKANPTPLPIQHPNTVSSFLDLSPIYGVDSDVVSNLRSFDGGTLKMSRDSGRYLMPITRMQSKFCSIVDANDVCFLSGDFRVNQTPQMAILHTIFVREHNRLAIALRNLNSHWDDERIFQEARRVVIAEYQRVTYQEWLPCVIGASYWESHSLGETGTLQANYKKDVNPGVISSFTSGAFRFLHSMIPGELKKYSESRYFKEKLRLSDVYFRPGIIKRGDNFEDLLRGLITQRPMKADQHFNEEISEYLFRMDQPFGLDLVSIDVKRARDHGVPGYNAHRELCGLKRAHGFRDLDGDMRYRNVRKLEKMYKHVEDIDLYVGIAFEKPIDGGLYGPTGRCIVAEQFYRSRVGDRYFYDNENSPNPFTTAQLQEIEKTTLARLICENTRVTKVQKEAFKRKGLVNHLVKCSEFLSLEVALWQEEPSSGEQQLLNNVTDDDQSYIRRKRGICSNVSKHFVD